MQRTKTMLAILVCTLTLAACGLKGPLYLPGDEPPPETTSEKTDDEGVTDGSGSRD